MLKNLLTISSLSVVLLLGANSAQAQSTPAPAASTPAPASSPAKKELIARLLKIQQPGVEAMARAMAEQPAAQMLDSAGAVLRAKVTQDKQAAVAKDIQSDTKKYLDEVVPMVRDRATQLAPGTTGVLLDEKFNEDELRKIVAMLESPEYAKYRQLSGEMQQVLQAKLVAETRDTVEARLRTLETSIGARLGVQAPAAAADKAAAPKPAAKPAKK